MMGDRILHQQANARLVELAQQNDASSEETLDRRFNMAAALHDGGKLSEAKAIYEEILPKYEEMDEKENVANIYRNLGIISDNATKYEDAKDLYGKCLEMRIQLFGNDSEEVAMIYNDIGNINRLEGSNEE